MDEFEYIANQNLAYARIALVALRGMRSEGVVVHDRRLRLMKRNLANWIRHLESLRHSLSAEDSKLERIRERAARVLEGEEWDLPSFCLAVIDGQ